MYLPFLKVVLTCIIHNTSLKKYQDPNFTFHVPVCCETDTNTVRTKVLFFWDTARCRLIHSTGRFQGLSAFIFRDVLQSSLDNSED